MNKPIIILAPAGAGKSTNAQFLMQALGCTRLVEEWSPGIPLEPGDLVLTNGGFELEGQAVQVLMLEEALAMGRQAAA
jgi:hypothetical protein